MNAIARLGTLFGRALTAVFGEWTAPLWLRWCALQARRAGRATAAATRARPRAAGGAALAVVALCIGGYYGHAWWKARPQPVTASLAVVNPPITDFVNAGAPNALVVNFSKSEIGRASCRERV